MDSKTFQSEGRPPSGNEWVPMVVNDDWKPHFSISVKWWQRRRGDFGRHAC
ncbi:hypothetical protein V6Z12_D03G040100 [Gossypium hirsutum]